MKGWQLLLLFMFLIACKAHDDGTTNSKGTIRRLTMADLKFPLFIQINSEFDYQQDVFPKQYNEPFLKNHVVKSIYIKQPRAIEDYDDYTIKEYRKIAKYNNITFHDWVINFDKLTDTDYYDHNGNIIMYKQTGWMPVYWHYKYDTLDFVTCKSGGSCVYYEYLHRYFFDDKTEKLYEVIYQRRAYPRIGDGEYFGPPLKDYVYAFHCYFFDTLGYVSAVAVINNDLTWLDKFEFEYDKSHKVTGYKKMLLLKKGSKIEEEVSKTMWDCRPSDQDSAKYFYHGSLIDSIVVFKTFIKNPAINFAEKTEFNSSGLPVRSCMQNPENTIRKHNYLNVEYAYIFGLH